MSIDEAFAALPASEQNMAKRNAVVSHLCNEGILAYKAHLEVEAKKTGRGVCDNCWRVGDHEHGDGGMCSYYTCENRDLESAARKAGFVKLWI